MKNLLTSIMVAVALLPAAEIRSAELTRGRNELVAVAKENITAAADRNKSHTWVKVKTFNFSQKYAYQKELQKNGYDFEIPLFGSSYIGW